MSVNESDGIEVYDVASNVERAKREVHMLELKSIFFPVSVRDMDRVKTLHKGKHARIKRVNLAKEKQKSYSQVMNLNGKRSKLLAELVSKTAECYEPVNDIPIGYNPFGLSSLKDDSIAGIYESVVCCNCQSLAKETCLDFLASIASLSIFGWDHTLCVNDIIRVFEKSRYHEYRDIKRNKHIAPKDDTMTYDDILDSLYIQKFGIGKSKDINYDILEEKTIDGELKHFIFALGKYGTNKLLDRLKVNIRTVDSNNERFDNLVRCKIGKAPTVLATAEEYNYI